MRDLTPDRLERALDAIDDANREDPRNHHGEALALVEGRRAHHWVLHLAPDADDASQLAARAHHLRRWTLARNEFPEGRAGYLRWRRAQAVRHGEELKAILDQVGYDDGIATRAAAIVAKADRATDHVVQRHEDAVALTFLEIQFPTTAARLGARRTVEVLAKTLAKMSSAGRDAAAQIELSDELAELLKRASGHT